mmetsp:Transcript_35423/g.88608  ORF Transcript_35423/g.88608 Transcript_35423/m.88608 type:complete len:254 (+) Transcript_35423:636-1397(+)
MRFSRRRRSASSMSHGKLVAASTITFLPASSAGSSSSPPRLHPSICTRNSDLTRREASCSPAAPRDVHRESISSMKMVEGAWYRARSKRIRTMRSDSPRYLDARVEDEILKKVVPHSVATALASMVLPVPGGPNMSTPFHGRRMPWKYSGIHSGSTTASSSSLLASVSPAMSSQRTDGELSRMSLCSPSASSASAPVNSGPPFPFPFPPPPFPPPLGDLSAAFAPTPPLDMPFVRRATPLAPPPPPFAPVRRG